MSNFKIGDRVRIKATETMITPGLTATVEKVVDDGLIVVRFDDPIIHYSGVELWASRFELIFERAPKGRFVVIHEDNSDCSYHPAGSEHATLEGALQEAREQADMDDGMTYVVFQAVRVVKVKKTTEIEELVV